MTWLALLAARQGVRAGLIAVAGVGLGLALLAVATAAGAAALIVSYPIVYEALRWGGVIFLLYLALEAWRGERAEDGATKTARQFRRGLIVNLLNPKVATVFVVLIASLAGGPVAHVFDIVWMSLVYLLIATLAHASIVAFAGRFQRLLLDPRREVLVRRVFALALVSMAIWFAFSTSRQ